MTEEHKIQNEIRLALADSCVIFRVNVFTGRTVDGRFITSGVPKGFSDLFGFRKSDGRAVFIEVKTPKGKPSAEQVKFLATMRKNGAISGICRSAEDALNLINGG
ncbi:MAG: VRR-NUC domain-containing protein [Lachnospiraceae bacterium]|nr:VRR-NUC domain-containing protein [Lachnospiraceae bacterium]MCM1230024.1 VRR-NUC domain-containing protein [Ruminococcus flavefaciens]